MIPLDDPQHPTIKTALPIVAPQSIPNNINCDVDDDDIQIVLYDVQKVFIKK